MKTIKMMTQSQKTQAFNNMLSLINDYRAELKTMKPESKQYRQTLSYIHAAEKLANRYAK